MISVVNEAMLKDEKIVFRSGYIKRAVLNDDSADGGELLLGLIPGSDDLS